jgi:hypothetical protein
VRMRNTGRLQRDTTVYSAESSNVVYSEELFSSDFKIVALSFRNGVSLSSALCDYFINRFSITMHVYKLCS